MARRRPVALTVAGTDSGGGAGVTADLKAFDALGVWGTCAVVGVTAQNTTGVQDVALVDPAVVVAQIRAVRDDIGADAAKTGMLATADHVMAVADELRRGEPLPLVVDPVFVSKHGDSLLVDDAVSALRDQLLPIATLVTPNLPEVARLVGDPVDDRAAMERAARRCVDELGAAAALVKGGHLAGDSSPDCLYLRDRGVRWFESVRIPGRHTHGTGCVLAASIAAHLAHGLELPDAVAGGRSHVRDAIAAGVEIGGGVGPADPSAGRPRRELDRPAPGPGGG